MGKPASLSSEEVYQQLKDAPQWVVTQNRITRDVRFATFTEALAFVNRVAELSEAIGHHPNISMHEYHFVRIESYNHLTNSLTEKDIELARAIEDLLRSMGTA